MSQLRPRPSNLLTYLVVAIFAIGAFGFGYLLFGELFVVGSGVLGVIGMDGVAHYFVWGRAMTDQAKKQAKAEMDSLPGE